MPFICVKILDEGSGLFMKNVRAVVFDLDGTLLNTLNNITAAVNHTLTAYGMPSRTPAEVRGFVGNGVVSLIARAVPVGTDADTTARVLADFRVYYADHTLDLTAPYDGILPMLDCLKEHGVAMAIVSNKPDVSVERLCEKFFANHITVALGDSPDRPRKPAPDGTLAALAQLGVSAEEAVFVGDGDADVLTARNAGMPCVGVTWGFRDADDLRAAGATVLADTPAQVAEIIVQ